MPKFAYGRVIEKSSKVMSTMNQGRVGVRNYRRCKRPQIDCHTPRHAWPTLFTNCQGQLIRQLARNHILLFVRAYITVPYTWTRNVEGITCSGPFAFVVVAADEVEEAESVTRPPPFYCVQLSTNIEINIWFVSERLESSVRILAICRWIVSLNRNWT